jgi:glycosyltransferase involved in cell wall biosynthesis
MTAATVDVVIPARDMGSLLGECLASVAAQSIHVGQVLVVDDQSRDDTAAVAAACGAIVISGTGRGAGAARNLGVAASSADVIAFVDADDLMAPGRLAADLALLRASPDAAGVAGRAQRFDEVDGHRRLGPIEAGLLVGATTVRRSAITAVGGFEESLGAAEFVDLVARLRHQGSDVVAGAHLSILRRVHGANTTRDADRLARGLLEAARRATTRRGDAPS